MKNQHNSYGGLSTDKEIYFIISQNVIPSKQHLGENKTYAFTEQYVLMLSSILKNKILILNYN